MDVLDRMGQQSHPEEDHLEWYVMKACSEEEADEIENHLKACENCRARLHSAEEWVSLLKTAIPLGPMRSRVPRWRSFMNDILARPGSLAMTGAVMATLLLAAPMLLRQRHEAEEWVTLAATRGDQPDKAVSSRARLHLRVDATDLGDRLEGQVVDARGKVVFTQALTGADAVINVDRSLEAGIYWLRINSSDGEHRLLREFTLRVI